MINSLKQASNFVLSKVEKFKIDKNQISLAIVLGSGLGNFGSKVEQIFKISYKEIPNFPESTVAGHEGALILAKDKKTKKYFWLMKGRVHYYEGYSMQEVVFPIRVLKFCGVKQLILTNAAGGANRFFDAGDLMLIRDHINLSGTNPLIGKNYEELGPRFPDMSEAYDKKMSDIILKTAQKLGIQLKEGVYCWLSGPTFETPAEIRMVSLLGADAVGMSTVPEAIVARHMGIKTAGISFISNKAAGLSSEELSHEEVGENAKKVEEKFSKLIENIISEILN